MTERVSAGWRVELPEPGIDPYLSATLWLLDHAHGALIADSGAALPSVHARALFDAVPRLGRRGTRPRAHGSRLGVVLVTPLPSTLERLDRRRFPESAAWMLVPSEPGSEQRSFQDAWVWALGRPAPQPARPWVPAGPDAGCELAAIVTPLERWALALRSGAPAKHAAALRYAVAPGGSGAVRPAGLEIGALG